jgi:hypothetical protein
MYGIFVRPANCTVLEEAPPRDDIQSPAADGALFLSSPQLDPPTSYNTQARGARADSQGEDGERPQQVRLLQQMVLLVSVQLIAD